jgi:hypothetical protein
MMGRQDRDQRQLFYEFSLDEMIPADHLLRRRGDGEFLFLAEGRPIKRKAYCTRSNAGTDASDCIKQLYHTIRLRSVRIISGYGMAACGAKQSFNAERMRQECDTLQRQSQMPWLQVPGEHSFKHSVIDHWQNDHLIHPGERVSDAAIVASCFMVTLRI